MDLSRFRGTGVALVTPFREDGAVDRELFARHVEAQIDGGVDFFDADFVGSVSFVYSF